MQNSLILFMSGEKQRGPIIRYLSTGTNTVIISGDFTPTEKEEEERTKRGGVAWSKLGPEERRGKAHLLAINLIISGKTEQFIVDRQYLTEDEIKIYSYIGKNTECTLLTIDVVDGIEKNYLTAGDIIFISGDEQKKISEQIMKGSSQSILISEEVIAGLKNRYLQPKTEEIETAEERAFLLEMDSMTEDERENKRVHLLEVRKLKKEQLENENAICLELSKLPESELDQMIGLELFIDSIAKGVELIVIHQSLIGQNEYETYKQLGLAKRYRTHAITTLKFDPERIRAAMIAAEKNKTKSEIVQSSNIVRTETTEEVWWKKWWKNIIEHGNSSKNRSPDQEKEIENVTM